MSDHHLHHLMNLIQSGQIYGSFAYMKSLPLDIAIPNRQKLFAELEEKVLRAKTLVREVNSHLEKCDYPRALTYLITAQKMVADYPNIQTDIDFIDSTMRDLDNNLLAAEKAASQGDEYAVQALLLEVAKVDRLNEAIPLIQEKLDKSLKNKRVKKIAFASLAALIPLFYLTFEIYSFSKANTQYSHATESVCKHDYQNSHLLMVKALDSLKQVRILNQQGKEKLLICINDMQTSTTFKQGIAGKVLHDGVYIPKKIHTQKLEIAELEKLAQAQALQQDHSACVATYKKALDIALHAPDVHNATIVSLKEHISHYESRINSQQQQEFRSQFLALMDKGDRLMEEGKWLEAKEQYDQNLIFAEEKVLINLTSLRDSIVQAQGIANVQIILDEAQLLEANQQTVKAIARYELAMALAAESDLQNHPFLADSRSHLASLQDQQISDRFVNLENEADRFFARKMYESAQLKYEQGLQLLTQQEDTDQQRSDISRLNKKVKHAARLTLVANKQQVVLAQYKGILLDNFNLSPNTYFHKPQITLVSDKGSYFIFKISALGSRSKASARRGTKYEVEYKYSLGNDTLAINLSPAGHTRNHRS